MVLNSKPTANVSIGLSSSKPTEGTVSASTLTFTPANWNVPQTVTVTGVDDFVVDPDQPYTIITAAAVSSDSSYSGIDPSDVSVLNKNIEFNGFSFSPATGLVTTEAGGQATFTVVQITKPTANVTLPLSSSNTAEGTVSASSLTFTKTNWNVPQTVTVTGVDDAIVDADVGYSIDRRSLPAPIPAIPGSTPPTFSVTNLNNDTAIGVTDVGTNHHYGQSVTLRATVTGLNGHPTTGLVDFQFGGLDLGTANVTNSVATLNTAALPIGTDLITATFLGDGFYLSSSGSHNVIIGKGQVAIIANSVSAKYGVGPPSAIGFTATGFVAPDDASIMTGSLATTGTAP